MKTVTLADVRERLPELIRDLPPGTRLSVTDGDTVVAELTVARQATPAEQAEAAAHTEEAVRQMLALQAEFAARRSAPKPAGKRVNAGRRS